MTVHWLRLFVAIAEHGNITKAARELHISQPSVSRQLKLFEGELQLRLFTNNGRGIDLTKDGQATLKKVQAILSQIARLKNNAANCGNVKEGHFTLRGNGMRSNRHRAANPGTAPNFAAGRWAHNQSNRRLLAPATTSVVSLN